MNININIYKTTAALTPRGRGKGWMSPWKHIQVNIFLIALP